MASDNEWEKDRVCHEGLVSSTASSDSAGRRHSAHQEEIQTTPLFSADVLAHVNGKRPTPSDTVPLPQYGFLAKVLDVYGGRNQQNPNGRVTPDAGDGGVALNPDSESSAAKPRDSRLFVNMFTPWSAFICGSQGSGKSHTLSCMLETALMSTQLGKLPYPLAGMVFHYDKFTGFSANQICEAACLCSMGIPVKVLVSPSNIHRMTRAYENMRGLPPDAPKPVVAPLFLEERQLNIERMMKLMAVDDKDGKVALYMETVRKILRDMAMKSPDTAGLDYKAFDQKLQSETLNAGQQAMLDARLGLLRSFMFHPKEAEGDLTSENRPHFANTKKGQAQKIERQNEEDAREKAKVAKEGIWSFPPGSLTIVDLSCPFVDESAACTMFNICLAIFLEERQEAGRIVALDEAHKFMTGTDSSTVFTESLLSVIRQQRHLATRVIIATQEPTISPSLLDLCSMTIVHRFTSRVWLGALKSHLAALSSEDEASKRGGRDTMDQIVELDAGQAWVFSPSAMLEVDDQDHNGSPRMRKLGSRYMKVLVRQRMSTNGGSSINAS